MDIDNLTDDEAIAIALLLGAEFVHGPSTHKDWNYRYFKPWSVFIGDGTVGLWTESHADTKAEGARN